MGSAVNRRRFQRNPVQIPVAYRRLGGGLNWTRAYDISAGGLKIRSLEPLTTGTTLEISIYIPTPNREKVYTCKGTVVWCHSDGGSDNALTAGVCFLETLNDMMQYL
jgi:hypothetical protein